MSISEQQKQACLTTQRKIQDHLEGKNQFTDESKSLRAYFLKAGKIAREEVTVADVSGFLKEANDLLAGYQSKRDTGYGGR